MRILVTGGAGFLGSHLVDRLLADGHQVVALDNFLTGRYWNLMHAEENPNLQIINHDLIEPPTGPDFEEPFDRVYNLASPASPRGYGRYPIQTQLVNSAGTWNALELARRHGARFFQASTSEVYGDPQIHPQTEDYWGHVNPNGPRACYDEGKRFAESLVMEYHRQHGLDVRIVRIFNTYGPRSHPSDGRVVPNFCVQALRGQPLTVFGDGTQTRSFQYVDDLIRGFILLMEGEGLAGEVVNLGNPVEYTMLQFAEQIIQLTGSRSELIFQPLPQDDPTRRRPDISKAKRLLNWEPEVPLAEGLVPTLAYFNQVLTESPTP